MLERLRAAARRWADPDAPERVRAVAAFLEATAFSETQVAFSLNEQMSALAAVENLPEVSLQGTAFRLTNKEGQPLAGLAESVALVASEIRVQLPDEPASSLLASYLADAVPDRLLTPADRVNGNVVRAEEASPEAGAIQLPWRFGVAVLDGKENDEARERLAEDVLLFNGNTPRCVRLIWAPRGQSPDPYLETFAGYRGRFPASTAVTSRVRMMTAFAQNAGYPLAYLDDHSLLVTRGEPDVQSAGHLRWVEYDTPGDVTRWLVGAADVGGVFVRNGLRGLAETWALGTAHRSGVARFTDAAAEIGAAVAG